MLFFSFGKPVFYYASAFNGDLSTWNVGVVTSMYQSKLGLYRPQ